MIPAALPRVFGWIALSVGTVGLLVSLGFVARTWSWHGGTVTAVGTVTGHRAAASGNHAPARPHGVRRQHATVAASASEIVRFADGTGVEHEFASGISVSNPFPIGAAIPVRYTPSTPGDAVVDTWFRVWGFPLVFSGAGLVFGLFGLVFVRSAPRVD